VGTSLGVPGTAEGSPRRGDATTGRLFEAAAFEHLWSRRFGADDLAELRTMKARAEAIVAKQGLDHRELKRGRGGIRDVEFSVQLLQLVHGGRIRPSG